MVHYFIMKQSWCNAKCSLGGGGWTCRAGGEGGAPPDTFAFALDNLKALGNGRVEVLLGDGYQGEVEKGLAHLKSVDISWIQEVFGRLISF
jgi:hypothetical protein